MPENQEYQNLSAQQPNFNVGNYQEIDVPDLESKRRVKHPVEAELLNNIEKISVFNQLPTTEAAEAVRIEAERIETDKQKVYLISKLSVYLDNLHHLNDKAA